MNIESIKKNLNSKSIYYSEEKILGKPSVIGYEKKFKWIWFATQLNTFIVVSDFGEETITEDLIENIYQKHLVLHKKSILDGQEVYNQE